MNRIMLLLVFVLATVTCQNCPEIQATPVCLPVEVEQNDMEIKNLHKISFSQCRNSIEVKITAMKAIIYPNILNSGNCLLPKSPTQRGCEVSEALLTHIRSKNCNITNSSISCRENETEFPVRNGCQGNMSIIIYNYTCCGRNIPAPLSTTPAARHTGDQSASGLSDVGKAGLAIGMGILGALLILLLVGCYVLAQRKKNSAASDQEKASSAPQVNSVSSSDNYGLPSHIHYVPYDVLAPRQPTPGGEYAEIDHSQINNGANFQDTTDLYSKPNKIRNNKKDQLIDNDVYEKDSPPNVYDNSYVQVIDGDSIDRKPSVQRMVENDVYNK